MARKPIKIGSREFKFKKDAVDFFRNILHKYKFRETIEGDDHDMLLALVRHHSEYEEKVGTGVKRFFTGGNIHGTVCFWIGRTDGTNEHFSYLHSINEAREEGKQ